MNNKESFTQLKSVMERDWRIEKAEVIPEREVFVITPYHGLSIKPFEISVWGDNELAALYDIVRRLKDEGVLQ